MADQLRLAIKSTASLGINKTLDEILNRAERIQQELATEVQVLTSQNNALRSNLRELVKIVRLMHSAHPLPERVDIPGKLQVMTEVLNG